MRKLVITTIAALALAVPLAGCGGTSEAELLEAVRSACLGNGGVAEVQFETDNSGIDRFTCQDGTGGGSK